MQQPPANPAERPMGRFIKSLVRRTANTVTAANGALQPAVAALGAPPEQPRDGFGSHAVGMGRAVIRGMGHAGNALNKGSDRVRTMALPNPSAQANTTQTAAAQAELNYLRSTNPQGTALWIQSQRQHLMAQIEQALAHPQHGYNSAHIVHLGQHDYRLYCLEQQAQNGHPIDPQQMLNARNAAYHLFNTGEPWAPTTTPPNPHLSEHDFLKDWPPIQTMATQTLGEPTDTNTRSSWVRSVLEESQMLR
jgi:hypothetical protein